MNESTSKSSLSSGKPSTANGAESSNTGKNRTIIVARSVQDGPGTLAPTAIRGGNQASSTTTSVVVNQHHARDARSGKLASYAALGGDEDVERFDQFLAEQRGQPRASELRAATTSPQHMLASMKRRTICEVIDGRADSGENSSVRKLVQQELENDARKRRDEAVAHRKWLNSLPIHERIGQQRQQNALRKWRQMNHDWEKFKVRAAKRLGKQPKELVMSRAADYREQREMYDTLQKARPLSDKVGRDLWLVSLRDEGTRYVPVGNIFSGLFCPIRESTQLGPRVRRPLDYNDRRENEQETSRPLSKVEKKSLHLLAQKKWRLRKQLEVLQPHEVQQSASSHLAVKTTDLFAWASDSREDRGDRIFQEEPARSYSATLDDVNSSHRRLLSSQASISSADKEEGDKQYVGPSLRILHISDDDEDPAAGPDDRGIQSKSAFMASHLPLRLSFYTPIGEQQQRSLSFTNDGGTIVHYQWWRARFEDESVGLTAHLRGLRTRKEEQELEACMCTSVSQLGGTLLPGETQQFVFSFEASKPGIFLEKWFLDANPSPRINYGKVAMNEDNEILSVGLPVEVRLSCVAEDNFTAYKRRRSQLALVEEQETWFFVALLVDEILDAIRLPEVVTFAELTPNTDVNMFYAHNDGNNTDVIFSPDLVRDCNTLYDQAKHILQMLAPLEPAPQQENAQNEDGTENAEIGDKPEQNAPVDNPDAEADIQDGRATSTLPPVAFAEKWDWRLETLRELCKLADEAQRAKVKCLRSQLKKVCEEVEEEEDDGEGDVDADDGDDDGEFDETEEDERDEMRVTEKGQQLTRRQILENERLARSKSLENELSSLQSDLQERFDMMRLAACTAPYSSKRLLERLQERIGSLCSEAPVVCEIVETSNTNSESSAQQAKFEGVRCLLTRAIDEAVSDDQDHQALFEQERRRMQGVWLHGKVAYDSLAEWMAKRSASEVLSPAIPPEDNSPVVDTPKVSDRSGVLLLQVDLDVAPWFSLMKADKGSVAPQDGAPAKVELVWRFSQDLIEHPTYVPRKVALAVESLNNVLTWLQSANAHIHTIVLVSELSRPPVTKPMYKLLRYAVQSEMKANALEEKTDTDETDHQEERKQEGLESTAMKNLLQRLSPQLSLGNIVQVLQRATQKEIVFCSTLEDAQGQIDLIRKNQQLNSVSLSGVENETMSEETGTGLPGQQEIVSSPRIVLLEHLEASGIELITHKSSSKPAISAATAPHEAQKASTGSSKKASAAGSAKQKPSTPVVTAPTPTEALPSPTQDLNKPEAFTEELSQQGMVALGDQFSRMFSGCILDGITSSVCENAFAFSSVDNAQIHMPVTAAGPTLYRELKAWAQRLQPMAPRSSCSRVVTAIVGGKRLASKLRLIDGLLDFVDEIYFVGEVAISLYRVLHTKQKHKLSANGNKEIDLDEVVSNNDEVNNVMVDDDENNVDNAMEIDEGVSEEDITTIGMNGLSCSLKLASPKSQWEILVPAVRKLEQKASRKCVQLLLPIDWIVGESPLDEQDSSTTVAEEDDEDDEGEEDDDMEEEAEEDENEKKTRKRKALALKTARQNPLVEPDEPDVLDHKKQCAYDGERAHVVLNHASARRTVAPSVGWRTFQEVSVHCLPNARVAEGKTSVLASVWTDRADSENEDGDEEGLSEGDNAEQLAARFEYEWTFRALDVGPLAMQSLASRLKRNPLSSLLDSQLTCGVERTLIINGVCGAIEFQEFSSATLQLLEILQTYNPSEVFIAGNLTAAWLRQLELRQIYNAVGREAHSEDSSGATLDANSGATVHPRKIIDDRAMRNARVLKSILAAKPHPALSNLMSADSA
ncbi:hypothetical protein PHYBOEH_002826 [Phytophthora boehmeriae]|uniref:Phosphoglycerate kinase n=1 Tax=Phytophthora boehmeriae TaxID=109152 RepID=A0A8T1WWX9_9STRA|nr:hypothetical protein PHYBOEH_002826 [Phytophthora boehmeriae]